MTIPVFDPAGPEAWSIASLIWWFSALSAAVWVAVMIGLGLALTWNRSPRGEPIEAPTATERRVNLWVGGLATLTAAIVVALTFISYVAQRQVFAAREPAVEIEVVGQQWWWQLRYPDPDPSKTLVTANELHIPVGQPVRLKLRSLDVIHSIWIPSLMGKADLVPGRDNTLSFTAQKTGVYAGQCAEFCGMQHSHMGMRVFVQSPADFAAWKESQIASAKQPSTPLQEAGQAVFLEGPCAMCHAIRGTSAGGQLGPDLTHLASRTTIAAGTADLTRGALAAWIADPQGIKPGSNMPTVKLEPDELESLLDYLTGLT
jgi:cytochrome c oxidase subunit II